jgi:hypothetical protein
MGISHFAVLVYGFKETPDLRQARNVVTDVDLPVCTSDTDHKVDRWNPPAFCPQCGSKVEKRAFPLPRTVPPADHYSAPGLDALQADDRRDRMINSYIHEPSPNSGDSDVVLGVAISKTFRVREVDGAFEIPEVTSEQVMEVDKLLLHNGINPSIGDLKVYLLIGGY